jgi:hypothetical protein
LEFSCHPDIRSAMNNMWMLSQNGQFEACFHCNGSSSEYTIVPDGTAYSKVNCPFKLTPDVTFAWFHNHANPGGPPSTPDNHAEGGPGDTALADEYKMDSFVPSMDGLYVYNHIIKQALKLQDNLDWQHPCVPCK